MPGSCRPSGCWWLKPQGFNPCFDETANLLWGNSAFPHCYPAATHLEIFLVLRRTRHPVGHLLGLALAVGAPPYMIQRWITSRCASQNFAGRSPTFAPTTPTMPNKVSVRRATIPRLSSATIACCKSRRSSPACWPARKKDLFGGTEFARHSPLTTGSSLFRGTSGQAK